MPREFDPYENPNVVPLRKGSQARFEVPENWQETVLELLEPELTIHLGTAQVHVARSQTDPKDWYYVLVLDVPNHDGKLVVCGKCKGFRYRDECTHVREILSQIG